MPIRKQSNSKLPLFCRYVEIKDGSYIVTGGEENTNSLKTTTNYNKGRFYYKSDMISARKAHSIINQSDYIYVFGGFDDNGIIKDCEKYDIQNDKWTSIAKMIYSKAYATPLIYNNNIIYIIGGFSRIKIDKVYIIY
jgi:N-acetylneuraminic acid mutarotase